MGAYPKVSELISLLKYESYPRAKKSGENCYLKMLKNYSKYNSAFYL